jgi:hypothetical protein
MQNELVSQQVVTLKYTDLEKKQDLLASFIVGSTGLWVVLH